MTNRLTGLKVNRDESTDIVKGLLAICVLIGHSGSPFTRFVYLFHVGTFFLIFGLYFHVQGKKEYGKYTYKKIIRLYIPYVLYNVAFIALNNILLRIGIYTPELQSEQGIQTFATGSYYTFRQFLYEILKVILFAGGAKICGPIWFLRAMFIASQLYCLIHIITNRISQQSNTLRMFVCIILSVFGYVLGKLHISAYYNLPGCLTVLVLCEIGFQINQLGLIARIKNWHGVISFVILVVSSIAIQIDIGKNEYTSFLVMIVLTICGFLMSYSIAVMIKNTKLGSFFSWVGRNSLHFMILHIPSFMILNQLIVRILNMNRKLFAAYPCIKGGNIWLVYTIGGITITSFSVIVLNRIKNRLLIHKERV